MEIKAHIQNLLFIFVALTYTVIMLLTFGTITQVNKESEAVRHLYFLKYCETEIYRKVCLETCLGEVPKITEHLIQIKKAQHGEEKTTESGG